MSSKPLLYSLANIILSFLLYVGPLVNTNNLSWAPMCVLCIFCKRSIHRTTDDKQDKKRKFAWSTIMKKMTKLECEVLNLLYSININKPHSTGWGLFSNSAISKFYDQARTFKHWWKLLETKNIKIFVIVICKTKLLVKLDRSKTTFPDEYKSQDSR